MHVPMVLDHISGSNPEDEDWGDVDDVRRISTCYSCGMTGHFERDCRRKGKGKEKGGDEARDTPKEKGKTMKVAGKKGSIKSAGHHGGLEKLGIPMTVQDVRSDTSRQSVNGESLASRKNMSTAEEVEGDLSQRRMEKSEECQPVGM